MSRTDEYLKTCEDAARAGGAVLVRLFGRVTAEEKRPADLVTAADLASQEAIARVLLDAFPDHGFLGEEEMANVPAATNPSADAPRWIVDPLDGTTNYAHGVPFFSVSVALEHQGELLVAVVFDPLSGEAFTAAAGRGARLGGPPLHTSGVASLSAALAAGGFPPGVTQEAPDVRAFLLALPRFQALRRTGSAALNLAYVAAGRFDAAWSFSARTWDIAAGALLVREAGGVVTGPRGAPFDLCAGSTVAVANSRLNEEIQRLLADV